MKIIEGFKLRSVAGEMIVSGEGTNQLNFNKLIALNSTATFLWQNLEGQEFDAQKMAELLIGEFDVEQSQALKDAQQLLDTWVECGLIEQ